MKRPTSVSLFSRRHEHYLERFFAILLFNIIWTPVLLVVAIGKIAQAGGLHSYISHFTNWSWTASAIFFTFETASKLTCSEKNFFALFAIAVFFWLANGMAWLVLLLVPIMFSENADILTDLTVEHGGHYSMGFALNMNYVLHYCPPFVLLFYVLLQRRLIGWTMQSLLYRKCFHVKPLSSWLYLGYVLFGSLFALGLYAVCFDIRKVYGIETPLWILILFAILVVFVFNGITLVTLRKRYVVH